MGILIKHLLVFLCTLTSVFSQALEPRLYFNAPVGLNFAAMGYVYTTGTLPDNTKLDLRDADLDVHIALAAYVRVIELFGQSGKLDLIVPRATIDGNGVYQGEDITRRVSGIGDIKGRFSLNLYGAPALSLKEFSSYEQDLIIGASLQITAPTGVYEKDKLVNIGTNRWAFKPSIGASKRIHDFTLELSAALEMYTDNTDFYGGVTREQDPIYSTQAHLIYNFNKGVWIGFDANYFWGGQSTRNGITADDTIEDSRYGLTFSLPLNKQVSLKLYGNTGISTRTGTDFDMLGFSLSYAFGAGL